MQKLKLLFFQTKLQLCSIVLLLSPGVGNHFPATARNPHHALSLPTSYSKFTKAGKPSWPVYKQLGEDYQLPYKFHKRNWIPAQNEVRVC